LTFRLGETTIDQLIEAALAIEVRAAELTAQGASDLEINDLQEIIQRTEQSLNVPARYLTALIDFHIAVTEMSHNTVFILAVNAMRNLFIQELNRLISDQKLRKTFILHQKDILNAIAEHDPQRAAQAMRIHLCHMKDRLEREPAEDR
jgi:GntR family transcriptional regulator, transcriptional repressor for pyruvate dehydrogenase complex